MNTRYVEIRSHRHNTHIGQLTLHFQTRLVKIIFEFKDLHAYNL